MLASLLFLAPLALASPLYKRQSNTYPEPLQRGPPPRQPWIDTYNAAKAAGKIPSFAPARLNSDGVPFYSGGVATDDKGVCSWSQAHCFGDNDIYDAPDGMYAINFDDGPVPASIPLYNFLEKENQTGTHFLIGTNVVDYPDAFKKVLDIGGHVAVHTWSHPYMTTMDDMQVLGELGWTAQAIFDHSNGIVPAFWRPPYGDADARVRAIAEEVFGLKLVGWNRDSNDWCLNDNPGSACAAYGLSGASDLEAELRGWQTGAKSPGCIGLEHETGSLIVNAFISTYPGIKQHGWDARCVPDLFNLDWYQNGKNNDGPFDTSFVIGSGPDSNSTSSASSATSSASSSASTASVSSSGSARASSSATVSSAGVAVPSKDAQASTDKDSGASALSRSSLAGSVAVVGLVAVAALA
ncbi:carbohydrate esterase family 4 protein [Rhodotorula graminis WP1]|uniref:chitin deacetylase n=1 Tax=Rhodotorula graminis (strain WP1) TaxID=578459 RepID=A0A194S8N3_RHOGW|nr:carbohydrate esterase family 4 protein [Rhodotorula graminis WP1]KPV76835.1 carbohydrate esterase family 4 protein [Rhodotorula graminis WP1]